MNKPIEHKWTKYTSNEALAKAQKTYKTKQTAYRERLRGYKDASGGECAICGYNRNYAALEYHHTSDKLFSIGASSMGKSDDVIRAEISKCVLVCANCHREIEHPSYNE